MVLLIPYLSIIPNVLVLAYFILQVVQLDGGLALLLSATPSLWPYIIEIKSHQAPFWKALRAYVGVVFHATLLLEHSDDSDVMQIQKSVRGYSDKDLYFG